MIEKVLVINTGSTSTKVALYSEYEEIAEANIQHTVEEVSQFISISEQKHFRKKHITQFLKNHSTNIEDLTAIVGRGGLLKPIVGGTYLVNQQMLKHLESEEYGSHASNLGGILAHEIGVPYDIPAYIVDPVVVDELDPLARISGLKGIDRRSVGHALNQKAVARQVLEEAGLKYEESNVIVAHLGGGISIAAHQKGRMIEMINGLDGEGPFSPERTGELPLADFTKQVLDENLNLTEAKKLIAGNGGLKSYLGETDIRVIESYIEKGDQEAKLYLDAMCYQIAKYIGAVAPILRGTVDYIILTGGISHSTYITNQINQYVEFLAEVKVVPGEIEMEALYKGVKRVLEGTEQPKKYSSQNKQEVF